jgi:WD40 repeat protein
MAMFRRGAVKDGYMKKLVILILLNFIVACVIRPASSDGKLKPLDVVFSKTFTNDSFRKVEFSRDGSSILAASSYHTVYLIDRASFSMTTLEFDGALVGAGFIPNSNEVFVANDDGLVQIWDSGSKKRFSYRFQNTGHQAVISEDSKYIAYGGEVYDISANKLLAEPLYHAVQSALQFIGNDHVLSAGYWDRSVVIRNLPKNTRVEWRTKGRINTAASIDDVILIGTVDGDCYVWPIAEDKPRHTITGWGSIDLLATHPREPIFAVGREKAASVYSLRPFKKLFDIKSSDLISAMTISDNGLIAIGEYNGTIQIWDIHKKELIGTHSVENDPIKTLAIDPGTSNVVAGTYNGKLLLLKASMGSDEGNSLPPGGST